jgi:phosphoribosylformimino-5-aminoimidazole carboxamide ribotide isomerase
MQDQCPGIQIIASGGVSNLGDIEMLAEMNLFGVIVGKAIYEGKVTLAELQRWSIK